MHMIESVSDISSLQDFLNWYKYVRTPRMFDDNTHVTDLCYCSEKDVLKREYPEVVIESSSNPVPTLGTLVHLGLQSILGIQEEVKVADIGGYELYSSIDGKLSNGKVVEFKYTPYGYRNPSRYYILQSKLYGYIHNTDVLLWSLSPMAFTETLIKNDLNKSDIIKLIEEDKSPRWEDECVKMCSYYPKCTKRSRGVQII